MCFLCTICVPGAQGVQKRISDSSGTEITDSCVPSMWVLGIETESSVKATRLVKH